MFPVATNVYISNEVADNEAILFIENEYFMGVGMGRDGKVEYSDEYKFLEDQRTYKAKLYATGRAFDNTCSVRADVSGLGEAAIPVKVKGTVATKEQA